MEVAHLGDKGRNWQYAQTLRLRLLLTALVATLFIIGNARPAAARVTICEGTIELVSVWNNFWGRWDYYGFRNLRSEPITLRVYLGPNAFTDIRMLAGGLSSDLSVAVAQITAWDCPK